MSAESPPRKRARTSKGGSSSSSSSSSSSGAQYWLVKVPPFVAADLNKRMAAYTEAVLEARRKGVKPPAAPPSLGKVRIYNPVPGEEKTRTELVVDVSRRGGDRTQHTLPASFPPQSSRMVVFSENDACRLEGAVSMVMEARVQRGDKSYKAVSQERVRKYTAKTTITKVLPAASLAASREPFSEVLSRRTAAPAAAAAGSADTAGTGASSLVEQKTRYRRPAREQRELRVRAKPAEVERMLLSLFAKREHYTARELVELTGQPPQHLREQLAQICDHHKTGELAHKYTLKDEYKVFE